MQFIAFVGSNGSAVQSLTVLCVLEPPSVQAALGLISILLHPRQSETGSISQLVVRRTTYLRVGSTVWLTHHALQANGSSTAMATKQRHEHYRARWWKAGIAGHSEDGLLFQVLGIGPGILQRRFMLGFLLFAEAVCGSSQKASSPWRAAPDLGEDAQVWDMYLETSTFTHVCGLFPFHFIRLSS